MLLNGVKLWVVGKLLLLLSAALQLVLIQLRGKPVHGRRLGKRLAEEGLDVRLTLSLVLTRLADGYDLVRQRIPRSVHQLAL